MFKEQAQLAPNATRNLNIETLRGLACLLLVAYHVIGDKPTMGLQVPADSAVRHIQDILAYIRMPLFTFLSGYVYAVRPYSSGMKRFLLGKARRLLVPMLVVGTLFVIIRNNVGGTNKNFALQDWFTIHILPVDHFWFVESLFWIFALIMILEHFQLLKKPMNFLIILGIVCLIHVIEPPLTPYFSIDRALYLLPYFLIGVGVYRYKAALLQQPYLVFMSIIFVAALAFASAGTLDYVDTIRKQSWIALAIGGLGATLLVASRIQIPLLASIGTFSYAIYLFHTFATSASRIIFQKLGIDNFTALFLLGMTGGIVAPIVIEMLAIRHPLSSTLLLGRRLKTSKSSKTSGQTSKA